MAKVMCMCGNICSGKSAFARRLAEENKAALLSADEITLTLFGQDAGDKFDGYAQKVKEYLYEKSIQLARTGINVVLDLGFWQKKERDGAREFYRQRGILCEFYFIDISESDRRRNIEERNRSVAEGKTCAYYVDEGLAKKADGLFEKPDRSEIDVWIENTRERE